MNHTPSLNQILSAWQEFARPAILTRFAPNSCIASTRIVTRALDHFHIPNRPLAVRLDAFNREFAQMLKDQGADFTVSPGETQHEAHVVTYAAKDSEPLSGATRFTTESASPPSDLWDKAGHVIAVLTRDHYIIDASLDQASRPESGILVPGCLIMRIPEEEHWTEFLAGTRTLWFSDEESGTMLGYHAFPEDRSCFERSVDWQEKWRTTALVDRLVALAKPV